VEQGSKSAQVLFAGRIVLSGKTPMAEDDPRGRVLDVAAPRPGPPLEGEKDPLLERLDRVRSNLDHELTAAPGLVGELLSLPAERREEELRQGARFHTWGVCELLLTRSAGETDPAESGHLARLTLAGADQLDAARHPPSVVEDLKARAWAAVGDARRNQQDLVQAEEALRAAAACLARGTGDLLVEARLLVFEASLRRQQGRTGEAAALLKMAAARYRETGEEQLLERTLAERSSILRQEGP
jgi:hypothetical protein